MDYDWKPESVYYNTNFERDLKTLKLSKISKEKLLESIDRWLKSEQNLAEETPNNKLIFKAPEKNSNHYVFDVRFANPDASQGKSGGFRSIVVYDKCKHIAEFIAIYRKKDLKFAGSMGRRTRERDKVIKDLKDYLDELYSRDNF